MKFKAYILLFTSITSFQLLLASQAVANYQEIITQINDVEGKISIPKNKYLASIKEELGSRKNSLSDLLSNPTSFCNDIVTEAFNSFETIITDAGKKICKGKKKSKKCIPKNIYDEIIPELEDIKQQLVQDSNENSFYDICENSSSPLGCLVNDEEGEAENTFGTSDTEANGCSPNEVININQVNLTESSTAKIDTKLDLGDIKALKYSGNNGDIYIFQNPSYLPIEIMATLDESNNVSADIAPIISLPPKSQKFGFKVCITNPSAPWSYKYSFISAIGFSTNMHTGDSKYFLPFKAGESYDVTQGETGTFSHFGDFLYSVDFGLLEGTEFTAMRDGKVVFVKEDSNEGGPDRSFTDKANFIWVLHNDGSIGRYVHLKQNGALVNVGDKIKAKDVIGLSGNTGFTSGPHLHVQVVLPKGFDGEEKIPIRFKDAEGKLDEGATYAALPVCK